MKTEVPFFENTPDSLHCLEACFKMILKYFLPDQEFSYEDLDRVTAKVPGLWTWPSAGLLWMQEQGFEVNLIETFDYKAFSEEGVEYLVRDFGIEVAQEQEKHSNIEQEKLFAGELSRKANITNGTPELDDIPKLIEQGYIIVCNINSKALFEREGYKGHFVVITGYDEKNIKFHNPGLPPMKNQIVSHELFNRAWAYPNDKAKNIMAFRKKN